MRVVDGRGHLLLMIVTLFGAGRFLTGAFELVFARGSATVSHSSLVLALVLVVFSFITFQNAQSSLSVS